jgi:hypothetical protein
MVKLIQFETEEGFVYVEVGSETRTGGQTLAADTGPVSVATKSLQAALAPVTSTIKTVVDSIGKSELAPHELEVEFGVKFSADAGVIISKISGEASISIKASWKKS